jgi:hypothetical protein
MDELGITEKAKSLIPKGELTELSKPNVVISRFIDEEAGESAERISIRFFTPHKATKGFSMGGGTIVPVVDVYPDAYDLHSETGFSLKQAEGVVEMANELKRAKEVGMLGQLAFSGHTVSITNPYTSMTQNLPQVKR